MSDVERARKNSHQQTNVINRQRSKGVEPSISYSDNGIDVQPAKFVANLPSMPLHKDSLQRQRKKQNPQEKIVNRPDIIAIAKEVYGPHSEWRGIILQKLEMLAEGYMKAEREECARIVEDLGSKGFGTLAIAASIRARSKA